MPIATISQRTVGIIGSAVAGPTLALQILSNPALSRLFKPILFDSAPDPQALDGSKGHSPDAGAGTALFANGIYPLHRLGLKEALEEATISTPNSSFWRSSFGTSSEVGAHKHLGTMKNVGWAEDVQSYLMPIEHQKLQNLLLGQVQKLGGQVQWNRKLEKIQRLPDGRLKAVFKGTDDVDLDLVVGADGVYSKVRKFILSEKDAQTAEQRWMPDHLNSTAIWGISSLKGKVDPKASTIPDAAAQTHGIWLDRGVLSTSPLPDGKVRWDILLPEAEAPEAKAPETKALEQRQHAAGKEESASTEGAPWAEAISPSIYPRYVTMDILKKHAHVYHPVVGSLAALLDGAERIVHTPLRQRVWKQDEIQAKNVVLIGDAARTMLPSSGSGTSFAIEDATVLADRLLNQVTGSEFTYEENIQTALREYAQQRLPRSEKMAAEAIHAMKMGLGETWYWRLARDLSGRVASWSNGVQSAWPFTDRFEVKDRRGTGKEAS